MMREEAIKKLKDILEESTETDHSVCYVTSDDADAIKMAIEALSVEPCDDCISRARVVEWLHNCTDDSIEHAIDNNIEFIPSVTPKQKMWRWISVNERLPEDDGGRYLVTDYCEQINRKRIHVSYCYVNREGFWSDVPIGYKVIAWMPLPEPYNEEKDTK